MAEATLKLKAVDQTQAAIRSATNGMRGLNDTAKLLKASLATIGVTAVGRFFSDTAKNAIELGDQINKAAVRAGVTTEALSQLAYAAKLNGVEMEALVKSLQFMQKGIVEAALGTGEAKRAFDLMGVSVKEVSGLSTQRQLEFFANKIAGIQNPAQQAYVVTKLFGEAGLALLPLLNQGAKGIRAFTDEADRLGLTFNQEQLDKLTEAKDSIDRMKSSFDALAVSLTALVAGPLASFFDDITAFLSGDKLKKLEEQLRFLKRYEGRSAVNIRLNEEDIIPTGIITSEENLKLQKQIIEQIEKIRSQSAALPDIVPTQIFEDLGAAQEKENESFYKFIEANIKREQGIMESVRMGLIEAADANYEALMDIVPDIPDLAQEQFFILESLAESAAQNMQSAFADFLFDPFTNGLKGMLKGFVDMIRRMIAQIAASMILTKFFSWMSSVGGFWGQVGTAAVAALKPKAMGGPVMRGEPYMVGERGPELFVPGSNGSIVPNDKMGGTTIAPVYNIDARGATADLQKSLPGILAENNRRIFDELDRRYGIGR